MAANGLIRKYSGPERIGWASVLIFILLLVGCSDDAPVLQQRTVITRKVAVIMPEANRDRWERVVNWALSNYSQAQREFDVEYALEVEWHDENASDLASYAANVARDASYDAVIGPFTSAAARVVAPYMVEREKTIILPAATSTEFQRIFAEKMNVWNLAQSDIAQDEIIISQAKSYGYNSVSLVTSDDTYGKSFSDWFAYQATELGVDVGDIVVYGNDAELESGLKRIAGSKEAGNCMIMFAPGKAADTMVLDKVYGELLKDDPSRVAQGHVFGHGQFPRDTWENP